MKKIKVNLGLRRYNVEIGKGNLFKTDFSRFKASKYAIITDFDVKKFYGERLIGLLKKQGLRTDLFEFPAGEKSKTLEMAGRLGRKLVEKGYDRQSLILALGGGVVGDLAGFVASFYKRGINYIQIPTTLVAQTDSSIGGKVGVNIPEGKNMFGYFYQPKAVITDIGVLKTLPKKEIKNGLAEVIKYGMIQDKNLFEFVEENSSNQDDNFFLRIVESSCSIKSRIIQKDERETELRKILNYGHTVGHALESAKNYKISHGEAIGIGMMCEATIAYKIGLLNKPGIERQNYLISKIGLPIRLRGSVDKMIEIMKRDKKNEKGEIYFVLPAAIGKVKKSNEKISFPVKESIIKSALNCVKI